jgi:long-chain acyl-CoA synthetase
MNKREAPPLRNLDSQERSDSKPGFLLISKLLDHARQRPDACALREATRDGDCRTLSWLELCASAQRLRDEIRRNDPNGVTLLTLSNRAELVIGLLAGLWAGSQVLPASPLSTRSELLGLASRASVTSWIADPALREEKAMDIPPLLALETQLPGESVDFSQREAVSPGSLLLLSSGTTGRPKIVRRAGHALDAMGLNLLHALSLDESDLMLLTIPLYHSFGIDTGLLAATMAGCTVELHERFAPKPAREALCERAISVWPAVPLMLDAVSRGAGLTSHPNRLRKVVSAGSRLPLRVFRQFEAAFEIPVGQIYGASEFGAVAYNDPALPDFDPESVGRPMPGVSFKLSAIEADEASEASEASEAGKASKAENDAPSASLATQGKGEVVVSAPSMMSEYLDDPSDVAWLRSGDIGRIDETGRLWLVGRVRLLIDVGSQKVNPIEVEEQLCGCPGVAEAIVIAMPYTDTANRLKAIIVPEPDREVDLEALKIHARQQLAPHKLPRSFEIRIDVPRSPTGKILRRALQQEIQAVSKGHS